MYEKYSFSHWHVLFCFQFYLYKISDLVLALALFLFCLYIQIGLLIVFASIQFYCVVNIVIVSAPKEVIFLCNIGRYLCHSNFAPWFDWFIFLCIHFCIFLMNLLAEILCCDGLCAYFTARNVAFFEVLSYSDLILLFCLFNIQRFFSIKFYLCMYTIICFETFQKFFDGWRPG